MNKESVLQDVLKYWFTELGEEGWFAGGDALDEEIKNRFIDTHQAIAAGEFWKYRTIPQHLLAEVIVLDQFSRNMFRSTEKAFQFDQLALALAQQAVAVGFDSQLDVRERQFLYMPFMHSESVVIHEEAIVLFESLGLESPLKYERIHKEIIDRFGRYPHRNAQLGRESTAEEIQYLESNHEDFFNS